MYVTRREVKKFQDPKPGDDVVGYKNVGELCKDVEALVDILWLSGTRKGFFMGFELPSFVTVQLIVFANQQAYRFPTSSILRTSLLNGSHDFHHNPHQCSSLCASWISASQVS